MIEGELDTQDDTSHTGYESLVDSFVFELQSSFDCCFGCFASI